MAKLPPLCLGLNLRIEGDFCDFRIDPALFEVVLHRFARQDEWLSCWCVVFGDAET